MTRFIFDQFSKDFLETLLSPYGEVKVAEEIAGEIREIDVCFQPTVTTLPSDLGILGQLAATFSLFEPYRNAVQENEIIDCLLKLFISRSELIREANRQKTPLSQLTLPRLWIITPTASTTIIDNFGGKLQSNWGEGIYFLPNSLRTAIVAVHKLPLTRDTLWLRLLGKGTVQQQAIEELVNLPQNNPLKSVILEVLYSLQKNLEVKQNKQLEDRELMMQLAPLYQEDRARAIQEGFQRGKSEGIKDGELNVTLRLLTRKLGNLPPEIMTQIQQLNLEQLEALTEALLDFNTLDDLNNWLQ